MILQQILIRVCRIVSVFQESVYSCYQDEMMVCHCQEFKQYTFSLLPGRYICTIYKIVLLQTIYHCGVSLMEFVKLNWDAYIFLRTFGLPFQA